MDKPKGSTSKSLNRHLFVGVLVVFLLVGGVGGWAAYASISGAVIAQGSVVVETNAKRVQHKEGGIVGEILVEQGQRVEANDLVIRLDDTVTRANLGIITKQLDELSARRARLQAERDGAAAIAFPAELTSRRDEPDVATAVRGETILFNARRDTVKAQKARLHERVGQYSDEIDGLAAQRDAKVKEIEYIKEELSGLDGLFEQGHVTKNRIMALRREETRLEGQRGQLVSQIARTKGQIAETSLQLSQLEQSSLSETVRELREVEAQIIELSERKIAAIDALKRIDIRAPRAGYVHELAVHTVGGVISPGETIMQIIPEGDKLMIEARVNPTDIDQVAIGQSAVLRLAAFNQRNTPELNAVVETVSADLSRDEATGLTFFVVRLQVNDGEEAKLNGKTLVPGMPTEVFIQTDARTALSYLVKPLSDHIQRAFREE